MDIQRIRNLTTHRLHTKMEHIYIDLGYIIGITGVMTHDLPNFSRAVDPYLEKILEDPRLFDGQYDLSHTGDIDVRQMTAEEKAETLEAISKMPSPFSH